MWKSGSWTQWDILPQIYLKTCPDFRERQAEHTAWFPQWAGRWCCEAAVSEQAVAIFPLRRAVFQTGASPGRLGTGSDSCSALYRQPGPFPASSVCYWASYLCSTWTTNEQSPAPREELGFTRKKSAENVHYVGNLTRNDNRMFAHIVKNYSKANACLDLYQLGL